MAGFPLMAIGAGIGQGAEAIQRQRQMALEAALRELQIKQYQDEQQAAGSLFPAALSGSLDAPPMQPLGTGGLGGGGVTGAMPDLGAGSGSSMPPLSAGGGGGLRAGGALTSLRPPVGSPENERITNLIIQDESGGRNIKQQVVPEGGGYNPSVGRVTGPSSAQGIGQFIDPTWREAAARIGAGQYAHAMDAPPEVQRKAISQRVADKGVGDWAPYNPTLARHLGIAPGGSTHPVQREADQIALGAASQIPPQVYGRMSIQAMAQAIDKANPGADPYVKMLALERGMKLVSPYEQRIWEVWKMQHGETLDRAKEDRTRQFQIDQQKRSQDFQREQSESLGKGRTTVTLQKSGITVTGIPGQPGTWTTMDGKPLSNEQLQELETGGVTKLGSRPQGALPALPELQPGATWDGKPNKPPPPEMTGGMQIDPGIWGSAVAYVKSGGQIKPPFSLWGENPMARAFNQALPVAEAALGATPEQRTSLAAAYASQRAAGQTVGRVAGATAQGAQELQQIAPLVEGAVAHINKTDFPTINSVLNAFAAGVGDPYIVQLNSYIQTAKNAYVQIMTRSGRPTVYANRRADELLNPNMGIEQIPAALDAMANEAAVAQSSAKRAVQEVTGQEVTAPAATTTRRVRPGQTSSPAANAPPKEAIDYLRQNDTPEMRQAFDQKYGAGAAARTLGQ